MKTFRTMLKNEMKLSLRDMNMVIFAICIPLVVLILLGVIYGNKPSSVLSCQMHWTMRFRQ